MASACPFDAPTALPIPLLSVPSPKISTNTRYNRLASSSSRTPATLLPSFAHCTSFPEVLTQAATYSHTDALTHAETYARACMDAGERLDPITLAADIAAAHTSFLNLITNKSLALLPTTLQQHIPSQLPPHRHAHLPVLPPQEYPSPSAPSSTRGGTAATPSADLLLDKAETPEPGLLLAAAAHLEAKTNLPVQRMLTEGLFSNVNPAILRMSRAQRLQELAICGGPILLHPGFRPNNGEGLAILPASTAPPSAVALHFIRSQKRGRGIILPLHVAQAVCSVQDLPLHVSSVFIRYKDGAPLGRLISNFSSGGGEALNSPAKQDVLAALWAPIRNPNSADVAQLALNAIVSHPAGTVIEGVRVDIADAYPRIRTRPRDVPLTGLLFEMDATPFVYFSLLNQFGSQDSNYHWQPVVDEILSGLLQHDHATFGATRTSAYTDDLPFFGSSAEVDAAILRISQAASIVGKDPVAAAKIIRGPSLPIVGWQVDTAAQTIGLTEPLFGKLLDHFFTLLPADPHVGDVIALPLLLAISSHAMRSATVMPSMRAHAKVFSFNTRGLPTHATQVRLSAGSVTAISVWRAALREALIHTDLLAVPLQWPVLLRRLPTETHADRSLRQELAATAVAYSDACTSIRGIGAYLPGRAWLSLTLPDIPTYIHHNGTTVDADINILELAAAVITAACLIHQHITDGHSTINAHFHIHSDNTSGISWLTKYSATHPLHSFLLQVFSNLQVAHQCLITLGHIKGVDNVQADAASRDFDCPRGSELREELEKSTRLTASDDFLRALAAASRLPASDTSGIHLLVHNLVHNTNHNLVHNLVHNPNP